MVVGSGSYSKSAGGAVVGVAGTAVATGDRVALERHQRTLHDLLRAGGDEAGVDQLDPIDLAADEQVDDVLADLLGVGVARCIAEAGELGLDLVAAEPEVALGLATDGDHRVVATLQHVGFDLALGGALHAGVVAAAQTAVGGDDDVGDVADRRRDRRATVTTVDPPAAARSLTTSVICSL